MSKLFKNIKLIGGIQSNNSSPLRGKELDKFKTIENGFLTTKEGKIDSFGKMSDAPDESKFDKSIDCTGKLLLPTYCDSHTHLVFAATREDEFVDRIHGLSYEEIAARGGGILNSAGKLATQSEDELYQTAAIRLTRIIKTGTGAIEIKSGYGLTVESEIKMLRVIKRLKENFPIPIKATFLGAHAFPKEYKENPDGYIDLIITEMLPLIEKESLADYIDAFCEVNYFTTEQTAKVCAAGAKYGLKAKIHVNQFNAIGGIKMADELNAVSVDHLEMMQAEDFDILSNSDTIATLLPSCSFFLSIPFAPAKEMIAKNCAIALASDFNPGSTPSANMSFVVALACIKQKITPEQALNAATINGAHAMELANEVGSITVGKRANFMLTNEITGYSYIPYSFGENCIEQVWINGELFN